MNVSLMVYVALVLAVVSVMVGFSSFLGQRHSDRSTATPFESGIRVTGTARVRFPSHFYLVAILFVVFDLESVFLYAWALVAKELGAFGFFQVLFFVAVLLVALVYVVRLGVLKFGPHLRKGES